MRVLGRDMSTLWLPGFIGEVGWGGAQTNQQQTRRCVRAWLGDHPVRPALKGADSEHLRHQGAAAVTVACRAHREPTAVSDVLGHGARLNPLRLTVMMRRPFGTHPL